MKNPNQSYPSSAKQLSFTDLNTMESNPIQSQSHPNPVSPIQTKSRPVPLTTIQTQSRFNPLDSTILTHEFEYCQPRYCSAIELFTENPYNSLQIITFSVGLDFVEKLLKQCDFEQVQLIIGADFLVKKKMKQMVSREKRLAELNGKIDADIELIQKRPYLVQKMQEGILEIHSSNQIIDHRKLYLLQSPEGQYRMISGSANATTRAFNGTQMETYLYCDSYDGFQEFEKRFTNAWEFSEPIPYRVVLTKVSEEPTEHDFVLDKAKSGDAIVGIQTKEEISEERIRYAIDIEKNTEKYQALYRGEEKNILEKDGMTWFKPDFLKVVNQNVRTIAKRKAEQQEVTKPYPQLSIDYGALTASLNDKELNLSPSKESVKKQIGLLLEMLNNYADFDGEVEQLQKNHWRLLNAMFASVFFAEMRCVADSRRILKEENHLPMYIVLTSKGPDAGKSFMVHSVLKMMTGKDLSKFGFDKIVKEPITFEDEKGKKKTLSTKGDILDYYQSVCSLTPLFIDEIGNNDIGLSYKTAIKRSAWCEESDRRNQPVVIFAGNELVDPQKPLRKRMICLRYDAQMPEIDFDDDTFKSKGRRIFQQLDQSLFCEYLKRMIKLVKEKLDVINYSESFSDSFEPDILETSSQTLVDIFQDYGFQLPKYIVPLKWKEDYSRNSKETLFQGLNAIKKLWKENKKAIMIQGDLLYVNLGTDAVSQKMLKSWVNTMPTKVHARIVDNQLVISKSETEKLLNMKFKKSWWDK